MVYHLQQLSKKVNSDAKLTINAKNFINTLLSKLEKKLRNVSKSNFRKAGTIVLDEDIAKKFIEKAAKYADKADKYETSKEAMKDNPGLFFDVKGTKDDLEHNLWIAGFLQAVAKYILREAWDVAHLDYKRSKVGKGDVILALSYDKFHTRKETIENMSRAARIAYKLKYDIPQTTTKQVWLNKFSDYGLQQQLVAKGMEEAKAIYKWDEDNLNLKPIILQKGYNKTDCLTILNMTIKK